MYCPHCGVQNLKETKFCRGCGEDLRLVSQAVTKSLPLVIAQRVDDAIDRGRGGWRSYQMFRAENRRAYAQALMGLSSLFVVVWMLMLGHGDVSFAGGFLLVMSVTLFFTSLYELWTRKRRQRKSSEPEQLASGLTTKELEPHRDLSDTSVTDSTTRRLKVNSARRTRDSRD
jgi:zinc-ribbon domain